MPARQLYSATAVTTTESGTAVDIGDQVTEHAGYRATVIASSFSGTPTFDLVVEDSPDGTNWFTRATFTQLTANGSESIAVSGPVHAGHVRITNTVGGGTPSGDFVVYVE